MTQSAEQKGFFSLLKGQLILLQWGQCHLWRWEVGQGEVLRQSFSHPPRSDLNKGQCREDREETWILTVENQKEQNYS